jgi:hypothetical protein
MHGKDPPTRIFEHPARFLASKIIGGVSQIDLGPARLNLFIRPKRSGNLIVFFSGAISRRRASGAAPPFFAGLNLTRDIEASLLAVEDPALQYSAEIMAGWYAGAKDLPLQQIVPSVIRHVAKQSAADRVILAGSSAGGFAALYYGTVLAEAVVLVVNPQTDIVHYHRGHVARYARVCFGWNGEQPIGKCFQPAVTSLPVLLRRGARCRGIYLQNSDDKHHIQKHAFPLIRILGGKNELVDQHAMGIDFLFRRWGSGHTPLPKPVYKAALRHLVEEGLQGLADAVDDALSQHSAGLGLLTATKPPTRGASPTKDAAA